VGVIDAASVAAGDALIDVFTLSSHLYPYPPPRPANPWDAFLGSLEMAGGWVSSIAGGI